VPPRHQDGRILAMIQVRARRIPVRGRPFGKFRRTGTSHSDPGPTPKIPSHWPAGQLARGLLFLAASHWPGLAPLLFGVPQSRVSVARATPACPIVPAAAPASGSSNPKRSIVTETTRGAVPRVILRWRTQKGD